MSNILRKTILGILILALGISIGILYETLKHTLYPDYVSITIHDEDSCNIKSVEIDLPKKKIIEEIVDTSKFDKYTMNYYSKSGVPSKYSIIVSTENCGFQKGPDREVYPGQVIYEYVGKDGVNLHIRH